MCEFSLRRELDVLRRMNDSKGNELSRYLRMYEEQKQLNIELKAEKERLLEELENQGVKVAR